MTMGDFLNIFASLITIIMKIFRLCKWRKNKSKGILFIDDEIQDFAIVETLKINGYNIDTLRDVENLEEDVIKRAKIIFVDFKGVGKKIGQDQGIDAIKALKKRYGRKKTVILFSAHNFKLSKNIDAGDDRIAKNAPLQDFITMINKYL